jgi:hypothetical protein
MPYTSADLFQQLIDLHEGFFDMVQQIIRKSVIMRNEKGRFGAVFGIVAIPLVPA